MNTILIWFEIASIRCVLTAGRHAKRENTRAWWGRQKGNTSIRISRPILCHPQTKNPSRHYYFNNFTHELTRLVQLALWRSTEEWKRETITTHSECVAGERRWRQQNAHNCEWDEFSWYANDVIVSSKVDEDFSQARVDRMCDGK